MNQTFGGILPAVVSPCNEKDEFLDSLLEDELSNVLDASFWVEGEED